MVKVIEITEDALTLWKKMSEKKGPLKGPELKLLLGKTVSAPLKAELVNKGLIKIVSNKPQIYQALAVEADMQFEVKKSEPKPRKGAAKKGAKKAGAKKAAKPAKKASTQATLVTAKSEAESPINPVNTTAGPSFTDIMEQVGKFCQPYFEKIDEIALEFATFKQALQEVSKKVGIKIPIPQKPSNPPTGAPEINPQLAGDKKVFDTLKQVCKNLDEKSRFGGEIPLPELWPVMGQLGINLTRENFRDLLLQFEDERKIDLHIANDPSQVRFPEEGINIPGRGLIYYVSLRK